jgi:hypothetical protein
MAQSLRLGMTALAASVGLLAAAPVIADPGHERPKITTMRWQEPPVTSCTRSSCREEILIVRAHDPDSSITEVQVWFSEDDNAGPIVFAHTYCVQGKAPGQPARLEIGATYRRPGTYTVAAVAYSHRRCLAHERGDRHRELHSRVVRLETHVR